MTAESEQTKQHVFLGPLSQSRVDGILRGRHGLGHCPWSFSDPTPFSRSPTSLMHRYRHPVPKSGNVGDVCFVWHSEGTSRGHASIQNAGGGRHVSALPLIGPGANGIRTTRHNS